MLSEASFRLALRAAADVQFACPSLDSKFGRCCVEFLSVRPTPESYFVHIADFHGSYSSAEVQLAPLYTGASNKERTSSPLRWTTWAGSAHIDCEFLAGSPCLAALCNNWLDASLCIADISPHSASDCLPDATDGSAMQNEICRR